MQKGIRSKDNWASRKLIAKRKWSSTNGTCYWCLTLPYSAKHDLKIRKPIILCPSKDNEFSHRTPFSSLMWSPLNNRWFKGMDWTEINYLVVVHVAKWMNTTIRFAVLSPTSLSSIMNLSLILSSFSMERKSPYGGLNHQQKKLLIVTRFSFVTSLEM